MFQNHFKINLHFPISFNFILRFQAAMTSEKLSVDLFSDEESNNNNSKVDLNSSPRRISVKSCEPQDNFSEDDDDDDDDNDDIKLKSPKEIEKSIAEKVEYEQAQQKSSSILSPHKKEISRFVVVSWKIRQYTTLTKSVKSNTLLYQYRSDATLESIIIDIKNLLQGSKVLSVAFICHGNSGSIKLCHDKVILL